MIIDIKQALIYGSFSFVAWPENQHYRMAIYAIKNEARMSELNIEKHKLNVQTHRFSHKRSRVVCERGKVFTEVAPAICFTLLPPMTAHRKRISLTYAFDFEIMISFV